MYIGEREDIVIIIIIVLSHLSYVIFSNLIHLTLSNLNIWDLTTINFKTDSSETTLHKFHTINVVRGNDLSYDGFNSILRGVILSSSYVEGGFLIPHRKPTSTLNFSTKFKMCIGLCMTFKFQF